MPLSKAIILIRQWFRAPINRDMPFIIPLSMILLLTSGIMLCFSESAVWPATKNDWFRGIDISILV